MEFLKAVGILLFIQSISSINIDIRSEESHFRIYNTSDELVLEVYYGNDLRLQGNIGTNLEKATISECANSKANCARIGSVTLEASSTLQNSLSLKWTASPDVELKDCYNLSSYNWYGGPEQRIQEWPIEKLTFRDWSAVTKEEGNAGVVEPYWLSSSGVYIYVDHTTPLFIDQNNLIPNGVCFIAKIQAPYLQRDRIVLSYTIGSFANAKVAHLHATNNLLGYPKASPDALMIRRPIWSTWAKYKTEINDTVVEEFAQEILDNNFDNSQLEIDDLWERCYGALEFDTERFPNISGLVSSLKSRGFRVTLWVHPFVNIDCTDVAEEGLASDYFVLNADGDAATRWWDSSARGAYLVNFNNPSARDWYVSRLKRLQKETGIDSFKFDAGETSFAPQIPVFNDSLSIQPNVFSYDYVSTCSTFGPMVEFRSGSGSQHLPNFVRMLDKDSNWDDNNGLYTLITTLLQLNMAGYIFVLPDMVGGNGYQGAPAKQLFIRWLEANVFMPSIQFSYVPWDYDDETVEISHEMVRLHDLYTPQILEAIENSIASGTPLNPPIWWVDPTDSVALGIDDEYLLGSKILVAPVITENAITRNIYLPAGLWKDGNNGTVYSGPVWLNDYEAPIEKLPYFLLSSAGYRSQGFKYFVILTHGLLLLTNIFK